MKETIDDVARSFGWDKGPLLGWLRANLADLRDARRALERFREDTSTHVAQERRLKEELADARAETARVRLAYQQQHDVWEELYVKEGIERLRARAEAYDGVQAQLQHLLDAVDTAGDQRLRALELKDNTRRVDLLQRILLSVVEAAGICRIKHLGPSAGEMTFVQRLKYFARESVKDPDSGAVSSKRVDVNRRALQVLLHRLRRASGMGEVRLAAQDAGDILVEGT